MVVDVALTASLILLAIVCLVSARVSLRLWLPGPRERDRLQAERVERMLSDDDGSQLEMT